MKQFPTGLIVVTIVKVIILFFIIVAFFVSNIEDGQSEITQVENDFINRRINSGNLLLTGDTRFQQMFVRRLHYSINVINTERFSPSVKRELNTILNSFKNNVVVAVKTDKRFSQRVIMAVHERSTHNGKIYILYVNEGWLYTTTNQFFFMIFVHEMKHVHDFSINKHDTRYDLEFDAYEFMGKVASETTYKEKFVNFPKVWKEEWRSLPQHEIDFLRAKTINDHLLTSYDKLFD